MSPLRIFIGYDAREAVAYQVLTHSILRHASAPVTFCPIVRGHLGKVYTRERGPLESTDFSITRFLVPYLSDYEGLSIFMDCDFLCLADIVELLRIVQRNEADVAAEDELYRSGRLAGDPAFESKAVWVCKHNYVPRAARKFLDQEQTRYRRKNWSSLMVFDSAKCAALTPEYVNTASGLELHQFAWMDDDKIGSLSLEWNWLVGEYPPNPQAKMLHFTLGGPWFASSDSGGHGVEWTNEYRRATGTETFQLAGVGPSAPKRFRR